MKRDLKESRSWVMNEYVRVFVCLDGLCDAISVRTQELDESQVLLPGCSVLGGSTVSIALQQDPIPLCLILLSFPPSPTSFPTAALGISLLMQKLKSDAISRHSTNKMSLCAVWSFHAIDLIRELFENYITFS